MAVGAIYLRRRAACALVASEAAYRMAINGKLPYSRRVKAMRLATEEAQAAHHWSRLLANRLQGDLAEMQAFADVPELNERVGGGRP